MSKQRSHKRGPEDSTPKAGAGPIWPWLLGGLVVGWLFTLGKGIGEEPAEPGTPATQAETGAGAKEASEVNPTDAFTASAEVVAEGERLFATNCAVCHGAAAIGQDPSQPMGGYGSDGAMLAPALNGQGHDWHHPPEDLFRQIKLGSPIPGSTMVAWEGRLTDLEIVAVMAYFQSLWSEAIRSRYLVRPHN